MKTQRKGKKGSLSENKPNSILKKSSILKSQSRSKSKIKLPRILNNKQQNNKSKKVISLQKVQNNSIKKNNRKESNKKRYQSPQRKSSVISISSIKQVKKSQLISNRDLIRIKRKKGLQQSKILKKNESIQKGLQKSSVANKNNRNNSNIKQNKSKSLSPNRSKRKQNERSVSILSKKKNKTSHKRAKSKSRSPVKKTNKTRSPSPSRKKNTNIVKNVNISRNPSIKQDKKINQSKLAKSISKNKSQIKEQLVISPKIGRQQDQGLVFKKFNKDRLILVPFELNQQNYSLHKLVEMIASDHEYLYVYSQVPQMGIRDEVYVNPQQVIKKQQKNSVINHTFAGLNSGKNDFLITPLKFAKYVSSQPQFVKILYKTNINSMQCKKICVQTKSKVQLDAGFTQYGYNPKQKALVVLRFYVVRMYRKMNYTAYFYIEGIKLLLQELKAEKINIFIHDKNIFQVKFFRFLGFKIQKVTSTSAQHKINYWLNFTLKKQQFLESLKMIY